jgi:hypothetical protein
MLIGDATINTFGEQVIRTKRSIRFKARRNTRDALLLYLLVATLTAIVSCAVQAADTSNHSIPTIDDHSTVGDGIPDWWKVKYGFSVSDPSVANQDPDGDGYKNLEEFLNGTDPNQADETPNIIINGGRPYANSLTISIQPSNTDFPNIRVITNFLMTNAILLANSGGSIDFTLPDRGDGQYDLLMQYADVQGQPRSPVLIKSVTVDRTPPLVYITSPNSDAVLDQAFITLQAVAADPNPIEPDAFRPLSIWINGQRFWDREGTNIVIERFPVPAGTNVFTVTIQVADEAGNTNQTMKTWRVDTSTATNAPKLLSVNLPPKMLLPDVSSVWVEGKVDNGNALVRAIVSAASGDVATNSLNVWKRHYEGLVPLETGTNRMILIASDAAGNASSNLFMIIRTNRYRFEITSPAFGEFATAPSTYVSGYVSAKFDEGLPTQTNVTRVFINGVAAVLGTNIDANGNLSFTTTNAIPLGVPITGTIGGPGIPADPPPN